MIQSPPRTILDVFENLPEGTLAEIINNQLIMAPSPEFIHQDIVTEIARQLSNHVIKIGAGKIVVAPMDVYFGRENVFQPDILFISNQRMGIIQQGKIKGAPDLIVEVLSPESHNRDNKVKKAVYEKYGVKEYWIVDPESKKVNGFRLINERYMGLPLQTGIISSVLLNVEFEF